MDNDIVINSEGDLKSVNYRLVRPGRRRSWGAWR